MAHICNLNLTHACQYKCLFSLSVEVPRHDCSPSFAPVIEISPLWCQTFLSRCYAQASNHAFGQVLPATFLCPPQKIRQILCIISTCLWVLYLVNQQQFRSPRFYFCRALGPAIWRIYCKFLFFFFSSKKKRLQTGLSTSRWQHSSGLKKKPQPATCQMWLTITHFARLCHKWSFF